MKNEDKSKEQLRSELDKALKRIRELEAFENRCRMDEAKISEQNAFLTQVLESLTHPFYVLDAQDYSIKIANSAARFGALSPHSTCYSLTHRRDRPCNGVDHVCPLQEVKRTKKPVTVEHVHYDREGNPRNMEVHAYPILNKDGNVVQMIEYSLDITDRKKLEEEIRSYAERIKLFAYSVSHDLKSPLIGINGLTRLLCRHSPDRFDEKMKAYCDRILKGSEEVLAMIEEINFYVRTQETPLQVEELGAKEIIQRIRDEFRGTLTDRGINWRSPEFLPVIRADRVSVLRAFRNLVDNAVKYGGKDLREITVGYEGSDDYHVFCVSDDGVGISEKHSQDIFKAFQRSETAKGQEGTGLGLAIVKEVAERHGGKAWVEHPQTQKGATFCFSLSKDP